MTHAITIVYRTQVRLLVFHDNDELTNKPNDELSDEPNDEPNDEQNDEPNDEPNDEQNDEPTDEPNDELNDEPTDDPRNAKHKSSWGTGVCWRQLTTNVYLISNKNKL